MLNMKVAVILAVLLSTTAGSRVTMGGQTFNLGANSVATVQDTIFDQSRTTTVGANSKLTMKNLVAHGNYGQVSVGADTTANFAGAIFFAGSFAVRDDAYFNMAEKAIVYANNGVEVFNGAFVDLKGNINLGLSNVGSNASFQVSEGATFGNPQDDQLWVGLPLNGTIKVDGNVTGRNIYITANDESGIHITGAVSGENINIASTSGSTVLIAGKATGYNFNIEAEEGALVVNKGGVIEGTSVTVELGLLTVTSSGNITGPGKLIVMGNHTVDSTIIVPVNTVKFLYPGPPMTKPNLRITIFPPHVPTPPENNKPFRLYTYGTVVAVDGPACLSAQESVPQNTKLSGILRMSTASNDCMSPRSAVVETALTIGSNSLLQITGDKSMLTVKEGASTFKIGQTSIVTVSGNYVVSSPMQIPDRTQQNLVGQ